MVGFEKKGSFHSARLRRAPKAKKNGTQYRSAPAGGLGVAQHSRHGQHCDSRDVAGASGTSSLLNTWIPYCIILFSKIFLFSFDFETQDQGHIEALAPLADALAFPLPLSAIHSRDWAGPLPGNWKACRDCSDRLFPKRGRCTVGAPRWQTKANVARTWYH